MVRVLSLLVENRPGVLARIADMFSGKGYNLESLTVGVTADATISRITLVCHSDDTEFEQIKKQLNRLIDVVKVTDLSKQASLKKELAFVKLSTKRGQRSEVFHIADVFGCRVIDVGTDSLVLEISERCEQIDDLLAVLGPYGVMEIARSGLIAMSRCKR